MKILSGGSLKDIGGLNPLRARIQNEKLADRLYEGMSKSEKQEKLKEAARGFEEMFVRKLLETMRRNVPESPLFGRSFAQDVYTSMLDSEIAKNVAKTESFGLADVIYKFFDRVDNSQDASSPNGKPMPLSREKAPVPLAMEEQNPLIIRKNVPPALPPSSEIINARKPVSVPAGGFMENGNEKASGATLPVTQTKIPAPVRQYDHIVQEAAETFEVDPNLIHAVIMKESSGNKTAVSPKGAKGLMQLVDGTARELGVKNPFDPRQNIFGGAKYLRSMLDLHNGDLKTALAAYNAGPGNVRRYGGVPPFRETKNYIASVMNLYQKMSGAV